MTLSWCHYYSLNNDYHCRCRRHCMQWVYIYFVLSCLVLSCLVLYCLELTSITIVIIGMTMYELVLHYHIISYHIISSCLLSVLRISSPLYTIQLYFNLIQPNSIWFNLVRFYSFLFDLSYCSVLYLIVFFPRIPIGPHTLTSLNDLCPFVCLTDCLSVFCLFIGMNKFLFCFLCFSFSYRFSFSSHLWFLFSSFYLMNIFLAHTCSHAHTRTHTYIWIYVPSHDLYLLLR